MVMTNRLYILNEVYFGKTPEVLKIEKVIDEYKRKYTEDDIYSKDLTTDPLKYKLGEAIENAFGFEICEITIVPTSSLNACTMPIGYQLDTIPGNNLIVKSSSGYKYKKEAGYCLTMNLYAGLLLKPQFSAAEVTAVILHEIGHNFTSAVFSHQGFLQKIRLISVIAVNIANNPNSAVGQIFGATNFTNKFTQKTRRILGKALPGLREFIHIINDMIGAFDDGRQFMMELLSALNPISNAVWAFFSLAKSAILDPISVLVGNTDENFADSFATIYGYGAELSFALSKLGGEATLFRSMLHKSSPFLNNLYQASLIPVYLVVSIFDEHSESCVRSVKILDQLKYEVEHGDHSPKFKKRIKQDITKVEKSINEAYYTIKDSDPDASEKIWAQFVLENKCYKLYDAILNRATPERMDIIAKRKLTEFDKIQVK